MAKPVSYYAKKELKTLENQLDESTQYGYGKVYQPIVNVLVNATKQMKEVYLNAVASERGTGPTESKHACSMQKKKESFAKRKQLMEYDIPKNDVDYASEVDAEVENILKEFADYRKNPNTERDRFDRTVFVTREKIQNEEVIAKVAKAFEDAGYYVWVERNLGRYHENGRLAVTPRPIAPNTGNGYRRV